MNKVIIFILFVSTMSINVCGQTYMFSKLSSSKWSEDGQKYEQVGSERSQINKISINEDDFSILVFTATETEKGESNVISQYKFVDKKIADNNWVTTVPGSGALNPLAQEFRIPYPASP